MKYFYIDIDGVIFYNGKINNKVLENIKKNKHKFIFCTGRGYKRAINVIGKYLDEADLIIVENGSKVVSSSGTILFEELLLKEELEIFLDINLEEIEYILFKPSDMDGYLLFGDKSTDDVILKFDDYQEFCDKLFGSCLTQVTIKFKTWDAKNNFYKRCLENNLNAVMSEEFISINHYGVNKGSGILKVNDFLSLKSDDIILIGNDFNDIPMFCLDVMKKIAVVADRVPQELKKMATDIVLFDDLAQFVDKL